MKTAQDARVDVYFQVPLGSGRGLFRIALPVFILFEIITQVGGGAKLEPGTQQVPGDSPGIFNGEGSWQGWGRRPVSSSSIANIV